MKAKAPGCRSSRVATLCGWPTSAIVCIRFWVRFDDAPPSLGLGMGVTGVDRADAESLLATSIFLAGQPLPVIREVIEDIDVRDLDQSHVIPNMGDPTVRGVWFPRT